MQNMIRKITAVFFILVVGLASAVSAETYASPAGSTPTEALDAFLRDLKESSYTEFTEGLPDDAADDLDDITGLDEELTQDILTKLQDFDYELSNEQIDGDTATVDATIHTYAFGDMLSDVILEFMGQAFLMSFTNPSEEEIQEIVLDIVRKKNAGLEKTYEATVSVEVERNGDGWAVKELSEDSPILDALLGGIMSTLKRYDELFDSFTAESEQNPG